MPPLLLPAVLCAGLLVLAGVWFVTLHVDLTRPGVVPVASVTVLLLSQTATTIALGADVRDASGNQLLGRVVTWNSSAPSIAPVDATSGLVSVGASNGTATITATCDGVTGSMTVTVSGGIISPAIPWPFSSLFG